MQTDWQNYMCAFSYMMVFCMEEINYFWLHVSINLCEQCNGAASTVLLREFIILFLYLSAHSLESVQNFRFSIKSPLGRHPGCHYKGRLINNLLPISSSGSSSPNSRSLSSSCFDKYAMQAHYLEERLSWKAGPVWVAIGNGPWSSPICFLTFTLCSRENPSGVLSPAICWWYLAEYCLSELSGRCCWNLCQILGDCWTKQAKSSPWLTTVMNLTIIADSHDSHKADHHITKLILLLFFGCCCSSH